MLAEQERMENSFFMYWSDLFASSVGAATAAFGDDCDCDDDDDVEAH